MNHKVDLTNCDKEPIHLAGAVQPHGYFCAFRPDERLICAASENLAQLLGADIGDLIGISPAEFMDPAAVQRIKAIAEQRSDVVPFEMKLNGSARYWAHPYWTDGVLAIDLEDVGDRKAVDAAVLKTTAAMSKLRSIDDIDELINAFARSARDVLGFDRVMVYQFDNDLNGTVIAEQSSKHAPGSFMGLTFPNTDIPAQARALFIRNRVRSIRSASFDRAEIFPHINPLTSSPFDLSDSVIRSVSPIHIEYLQNMGVRASLSISLLDNNKLWGLIACHHYQSEKYAPPRVKATCIGMCEAFSLRLSEIEARRRASRLTRKLRTINQLYDGDLENKDLDPKSFLPVMEKKVLSILDADGVRIEFEGAFTRFGALPSDDFLDQICAAAKNKSKPELRNVVVTDNVETLGVKPLKECAGALFYNLPGGQGSILAIRKEQPQSISWAGDPDKKAYADPTTNSLHPRRSFKQFQQMRRGRSAPWPTEAADIAPDLANTVYKIAIRIARRIAREKSLALQKHITTVQEKAAREIAKQSEENRLLSERLTLATAAGEIGVWAWDLESGAMQWDERMYSLYDMERGAGQLAYEDWREAVHKDDIEELELHIADALAGRTAYHPKFRIKDKTQALRHLEARGHIEKDEAGKPVGIIGVCWNTTEQKKIEARLENLVGELSASNAELERFAYVASHDLREPLRMITSFAKLIEERYAEQLDEAGKEYIRFSVEAADRMQQMIDDLLEYARMGQEAERIEVVDADRLMTNVKENLRESIKDANAVVAYERLPQIMGNAVRLTRLLQNLVGNGIKYQPPGRAPKIYVSATREGDDWVFCVKDNGIGISEEYQQQIFEPFRRLHGKQEFSGAGIGLSICNKIVKGHGGRIWVESALGKGSAFKFTIPARLETEKDDEANSEKQRQAG